ncbi:electron transporter SenC [Mesorhizobium sanjuanii]|uniref:Electron transporter SenC n=1 Tax=Mesorhizobium sanjuanii TaxID=2037900 RepID=A0A2A6F9K9_9HYPH|nr:SCO family protein [Mesorhizobium sanjuanii]PDQ18650.1 electron transporter SenC [Mesorhizobium sanjuanii]
MRHLPFVFAILAGIGFGGAALAHGNNHGADAVRPGPASAYAFALPQPGSYHLPPIRTAAGGPVLTEKGENADLAELLRGHITVFSFIYTRCADICPAATAQLAQLRALVRHYPELNRRVRLVSMSFDPDHDTPAVMADYGTLWRDPGDGGSQWLFVTAPGQAALRPILAAYDQAVAPDPDPQDPTGGLSHILRVFLIDEVGLVRNIYSMDFLDPDLVLTDIRTLATETE